MPENPTTSVTFHYQRASDFSTHHIDGAQLGATPLGYIYISFFLERPLNPIKATFAIDPFGQLGKITDQQIELGVKPGTPELIREMQTSIVLGLPAAKGLIEALTGIVAQIENQISTQHKTLEPVERKRSKEN